jgi:hypothetical protein
LSPFLWSENEKWEREEREGRNLKEKKWTYNNNNKKSRPSIGMDLSAKLWMMMMDYYERWFHKITWLARKPWDWYTYHFFFSVFFSFGSPLARPSGSVRLDSVTSLITKCRTMPNSVP